MPPWVHLVSSFLRIREGNAGKKKVAGWQHTCKLQLLLKIKKKIEREEKKNAEIPLPAKVELLNSN